MFTVLDPLLEFTYHLLSSWRKFALCIQSLLCMLFLFGWPPCQRSDMILMEVCQRAYDMIHYISGLYGYLYVCEICVNLIWCLYLFMLNKFCLGLSLSLSLSHHVMRAVGVRALVDGMAHRADSRFAASQWETALLCNDVFRRLGASLESTLLQVSIYDDQIRFCENMWNQIRTTVCRWLNRSKICFGICSLDRWPLTLTVCVDITFVNGKCSKNFMTIRSTTATLWKGCDGKTDRQRDGQDHS